MNGRSGAKELLMWGRQELPVKRETGKLILAQEFPDGKFQQVRTQRDFLSESSFLSNAILDEFSIVISNHHMIKALNGLWCFQAFYQRLNLFIIKRTANLVNTSLVGRFYLKVDCLETEINQRLKLHASPPQLLWP